MSGFLMGACRIAGMLLAGLAVLMLAELARFGVVTADGEAWGTQKTLTVLAVLLTLGFLLAFGGVKQ